MEEGTEQEGASSKVSCEAFSRTAEVSAIKVERQHGFDYVQEAGQLWPMKQVAYVQWDSPLRPTVDFSVRLWTPTPKAFAFGRE